VRAAGEEELEELQSDGKRVFGFTPGKVKEFDAEQELDLTPEAPPLKFTARSRHSAVGEEAFRIVYQPPTATIGAVRPADEGRVYSKEVTLHVELAPPDDKKDYEAEAEVLVKDQSQSRRRLDPGSRDFEAKLTLEPGLNAILVRLRNKWGASAERDLKLTYKRPPRVTAFDAPRTTEKAALDLSAEALSPAELPPTEASINGVAFRGDRLKADLLDRAAGRWKLTLIGVGLKEGNNLLALTVANPDGLSTDDPGEKPATAEVRSAYHGPPPPLVRFLSFPDGGEYPVSSPALRLAFRVESELELKSAELRDDRDKVLYTAVPDDLKRRGLEGARDVRLTPGRPTTFRLVARNEGGIAEARVTLTAPERPAFVEILSLESFRTGKVYKPRSDAQGAVFDEVPEGRVRLRGRISWNDPDDERFRDRLTVQVYANGFRQLPVDAEPERPKQAERAFTATVLLTRETDNRIVVELLDAKQGDGQRDTCLVRHCPDWIRGRRLHLVAVGIGETDGPALERRALEAINARKGPDGRLQAPPFEEVPAVDVLVGGVSKGQLIRRLLEVKRRIQAAAAAEERGPVLGEVVLLYYQGREAVKDGKRYLLTADSKDDADLERTGVTPREIVELFDDARGAQVVMLDVEHARLARGAPEDPEGAGAFKGTRLGVFYSFWDKAPDERLLALLKRGWPQATTLESLGQQVDALRQRLAPQLQFVPLPGDLAWLEFGGKR
jgi:hypothetical protein